MANKIKYGLKNVYAAVQTYSSGSYTYATPVAIPGAVSMSLSAQGENSPMYCDDTVYYRTVANQGYSGDLEIALIPEWFRTTILKETEDNNHVLMEKSTDIEPVYFALLFEFDGDDKAVRHVIYNCTVARPSLESQTKEASISPGTEKLTLTADPREDGLVKCRTGGSTTTTAYNNWYSSVYEPVTGTVSQTPSG